MVPLASILILLVASSGVGAIPVPPGGNFAYPGAPELATGAWKAVAENTDPTMIMAVPNANGQLSQRQPTIGETVTTVISYVSYQCVNDNTFVATTKGISYPSLTAISQCSIVYINETHRAVNSLPLSGGQCPNAAFAGFNLGTNGAYVSSNIYEYVDGVLPRPASYVCKNGTALFSTAAAAPAPTLPPPARPTAALVRPPAQNTTSVASPVGAPFALSPPPPYPPSPFPTLPDPSGAATPLGLWKTTNVVEIITRDGFYASSYYPYTNTLLARRSQRRDSGSEGYLDIVVALEGNECPSLEDVVGTNDGAPSIPFRFILVEP
jgi:hypothetical protein